MKKRKIAVLALIIGCLAILASGTITYFTAEGSTQFQFNAGRIDVRVLRSADDSGDSPAAEPVSDYITPGQERPDVIRFINSSSQPAYLRAAVHKDIRLVPGSLGTPDYGLVSLDINTRDWIERDGYYYYRYPLWAGEKTEPLFTRVQFSPAMDNLYQGSTISVGVTADAVQVLRNGDNVMEAAGWP